MKSRFTSVWLLCALHVSSAWAWGNHTLGAYRALEAMPEVATAAPVQAEPLEAFLKAQEHALQALLASQEVWAAANLEGYPARPKALEFSANPERSDAQRRLAFTHALRIAPNSKFALYVQPDPRNRAYSGAPSLPHSAINTLPESSNATQRFIALKAGDWVTPLAVLASASDEPDYGLDINLWEDSPSEWGKRYGFGKLPFGNPSLSYSTQAPFHMGFMHESKVLYMAAPFIKRTFPQLRTYQYATLAAMAFRTGHPYWGWRFTGLALHYLQDLTQPYHASLAPGHSVVKLLAVNSMAMIGVESFKNDMIVLLSNRHLALEKYQTELLHDAAIKQQDTGLTKALRDSAQDAGYPAWHEHYLRDVVAAEAAAGGSRLVQTLLATLPAKYVSDPSFDFGVHEDRITMVKELASTDTSKLTQLDQTLAELLGHFGAHSRKAVLGILKAKGQ